MSQPVHPTLFGYVNYKETINYSKSFDYFLYEPITKIKPAIFLLAFSPNFLYYYRRIIMRGKPMIIYSYLLFLLIKLLDLS